MTFLQAVGSDCGPLSAGVQQNHILLRQTLNILTCTYTKMIRTTDMTIHHLQVQHWCENNIYIGKTD